MINTNAAARAWSDRFFRNIEPIVRHAEQLGLVIGLENPGDGSDNLINTAADGIALLDKLGCPNLRLNYDAANTISHRPPGKPGGVIPADDALLAMPYCGHVHIKDAKVTPEGYFFTPLGEGDIDCARIVQAVITSYSIHYTKLYEGPEEGRDYNIATPAPTLAAPFAARLKQACGCRENSYNFV